MERFEPEWLLFASDAAWTAVGGGIFLLLAGTAFMVDRQRHRRDRVGAPDRVGLVPWTTVFLVCIVIGGGLIAAALPGLLAGR